MSKEMKKEEKTLKILIFGNCATGKTSLMVRYVDNIYNTFPNATIGADFRYKSKKC